MEALSAYFLPTANIFGAVIILLIKFDPSSRSKFYMYVLEAVEFYVE